MKQKVNKLYSKVGVKSDRTKNITNHVIVSFFYKGGSVLASFLVVPLTINFLDTENYGIWLTLSSFIAWFSFFDIGLGNGLRNKFTEAKAKGDLNLARAYVSSAYYTIGSICLLLMLFFFGLNFFIDWTSVFNVSDRLRKELGILMPIVFSFFCIQLLAKLITTIYTADQKPSMEGKINFFSSILSLLALWLLKYTTESSLLIFGIIFSALPVIILIWLNLFAFSTKYKDFKPKFSLWKKEYLKDIFGVGFMFFIIQISGIIIFSTDSLIIAKMLGPIEVVPYQIAFKYFSISTMTFAMIITPYWSGFTEAYFKKDKEWINNSIFLLIKYSLFFVFVTILLLIINKWFFKIWLGDKVHISLSLSVLMALYIIQSLIITPFTIYINGTGKIFIQTLQSIFSALINIPLAIFFVNQFNMGSSGVILATIISLIPSLILAPIQTWKLTKGTATNLFNK